MHRQPGLDKWRENLVCTFHVGLGGRDGYTGSREKKGDFVSERREKKGLTLKRRKQYNFKPTSKNPGQENYPF